MKATVRMKSIKYTRTWLRKASDALLSTHPTQNTRGRLWIRFQNNRIVRCEWKFFVAVSVSVRIKNDKVSPSNQRQQQLGDSLFMFTFLFSTLLLSSSSSCLRNRLRHWCVFDVFPFDASTPELSHTHLLFMFTHFKLNTSLFLFLSLSTEFARSGIAAHKQTGVTFSLYFVHTFLMSSQIIECIRSATI